MNESRKKEEREEPTCQIACVVFECMFLLRPVYLYLSEVCVHMHLWSHRENNQGSQDYWIWGSRTVDGWMDGWMDGWKDCEFVQRSDFLSFRLRSSLALLSLQPCSATVERFCTSRCCSTDKKRTRE